jgi:hypothetical protein
MKPLPLSMSRQTRYYRPPCEAQCSKIEPSSPVSLPLLLSRPSTLHSTPPSLTLTLSLSIPFPQSLPSTPHTHETNPSPPEIVAHRINTIVDSDRIVVLDHGSVREFDTPQNLVKSKGLFYELVREAGLLSSVEGGASSLKDVAVSSTAAAAASEAGKGETGKPSSS